MNNQKQENLIYPERIVTSEMFQSFIGCISNYSFLWYSQTSAEITLMTQLSGCLDKLSSDTNMVKTTVSGDRLTD